jgi:hypothetical protein
MGFDSRKRSRSGKNSHKTKIQFDPSHHTDALR